MKILSEKLRKYLEQHRISQDKFSEILGIDSSTLTDILDEKRLLNYEEARNFIYNLGAYEASKFIDWEGMKIERPRI